LKVETLQLHALDAGEAILILHCQLERERIGHTQNNLKKIKGVIEIARE
jgi:hypothetical protein